MSRILVALLLIGPLAGAAPEEAPIPVLEDGVLVRVEMARGRAVWLAKVEVPEEAEALAVAVSGATDVNLYLRRSTPALEDLAAEADASGRSESHQEVVSLTPFSEARLLPGTWFVTVENPTARARGAEVEIVAFVDRPGVPRTLLPGGPVSATLPGAGGAIAFRTLLPRRALSMDLGFRARDPSSLRFSLEGPEGYDRRGPGLPHLLVARDEAPPGVYSFTLESGATASDRRITAVTSWELGPGRRLPGDEAAFLEPGRPRTAILGGEGNPEQLTARLSVPRGTTGLVLTASVPEGATADVDLYVRRDREIREPDQDADYLGLTLATGPGAVERVVVAGARPLPPGVYHVQALLLDPAEAVEVTLSVERLPSSEADRTWGPAEPPTLPTDTWVQGTVRPEEAAITWHAVDVPAGAHRVVARLVDSSAPLDLLLARRVDGAVFHRALSVRVDESLDVEFPAPLPEARRLLLGVLSREAGERLVTYRVAASVDRAPDLPKDLDWPPRLSQDGAGPLGAPAGATVEIMIDEGSGGTGTCLTPGGLLLTCRHVVETQDENEEGEDAPPVQRTGILVGFPQRLDQAPVQAFTARVVAEDHDLDLALLQVDADVYGRPLPDDLALPWVPLGDSTALHLGDALTALGYPTSGSTHMRTALVVSRGIVAGLERVPGEPPWIKTDAWIGSGHSGGALVDAEGRLVGVPAATLGDHERLGLAVPVESLPAAWRARIQKGLPSK